MDEVQTGYDRPRAGEALMPGLLLPVSHSSPLEAVESDRVFGARTCGVGWIVRKRTGRRDSPTYVCLL